MSIISLGTGGESADGSAEGFAQRAGVDVNAVVEVEEFADAASVRTYDTGRVALVDHHQGIVFLGQGTDFVHGGYVAVHREHAVGHDDAEALGLGLLQAVLELFHVGVGIAVAFGLAQGAHRR